MATRKIELLSPAKNLEVAKTAILSGADSIYIGATSFGARYGASNSMEDIKNLCDFAGSYNVGVYVALNTLLDDSNLSKAQDLTWNLYDIGVEALIIQDLGLLECQLPPIKLHASTQCHVDSLDKVKFLENVNFDTVVLARELSLNDIAHISKNTKCKIEAFVHGALCVSYSGQCYLSYAMGGRSANKGECAQPCRLKYDLLDDKNISSKSAYYLSLKDMNRSAYIADMINAGVSVLKIEGRLKDISYVRNVVSSYRKIIDKCLEDSDLTKRSFGEAKFGFEPDLDKTFNRGYTSYNINSQMDNVGSLTTPKSRGEYIGKISGIWNCSFEYENADKIFSNGDGLMFEYGGLNHIIGAQVIKVNGAKVYLDSSENLKNIKENISIWRNKDVKFLKAMSSSKMVREIAIDLKFSKTNSEYKLRASLLENKDIFAELSMPITEFELADNQEYARQKIVSNLCKFGNTIFKVEKFEIYEGEFPNLKNAQINEMRRNLSEILQENIKKWVFQKKSGEKSKPIEYNDLSELDISLDYRANVINANAEKLYEKFGLNITEYGLEHDETIQKDKCLMYTKYCILKELGKCNKLRSADDKIKTLYLRNEKINIRVQIDCSRCGMSVYKNS